MQTNHPDGAPGYYEMAGSVRGRSQHDVVLLTGDEDRPDNYRMRFGENGVGAGDKGSPRHRHNFDQIRYPLKGEHPIGPDMVIPEGWVGYFPEGSFYGPYGLPTVPLTMLVVQFGGASGDGYASVAQGRKGYDALVARGGRFEDGIYAWEDENGETHKQDAFEAKWEAIYERKITYPEARYHTFNMMNPAAYAWIKDAENPGVAHKLLGAFSEREIRIGFVQVNKGSSFTFGTEPAGEILFVTEGALSYKGMDHPARSAFATAAGDDPETLTATDDAEIFYLKLPTF